MTEREIFLALLDLPDSAARVRYLDRVCGGDRARRARVEALLRSHETAGSFLDSPAVTSPEPGTARTQTSSGGAAPDDRADHNGDVLAFLAPPRQSNSLGRIGHYEILEILGVGGFGIVFRAFDEVLERVVAVKVLAPQMAATSPARKRFLREARSSAQVRHEQIVQVYAVEEQPLPYLVMEFIPGETLQQRLDRTGPLETVEVVQIGRQIAEGLAAAHSKGLIHRDIKPGNILIESGPDLHVKLTDFGLARAVDDASMTQSGIVAGTPMFMAPEQAKGESLDHRADLFSLGSVLYTMCSGRPPFRANGALAVLKRVAEDTPRPIQEIIPEVPAWLCEIIARLHAKKPEDRFSSAREVADLLAGCQADVQTLASAGPVLPRVEAPAARPAPWAERKRTRIAAALLALALLGGLGVTEATGVTHVRGTVIRLFSPEGTLVIEVDDPGVKVVIDGEDMVISGAGAREVRLRPGRYKVQASKDGKLVCQELVTIARHGHRVVRVSREASAAEQATETAAGKPPQAAARWERSVVALPAEAQVTALAARLKQLNPDFDGTINPTIENGIVTGLEFLTNRVADISPIRAFPRLTALNCRSGGMVRGMYSDLTLLKGMPLKSLNGSLTSVSDLTPLSGMPLTDLFLDNTFISDLSPLEGMSLKVLNCSYSKVSSLAPLKRMHLRVLWCNHTQIADLSPLKGMPLEWITIHGTNVSDLSPLMGMPLTQIFLDFDRKRDREVLLTFKKLQKINDKPPAEFWKEVDR
jgi:hypothetical protein